MRCKCADCPTHACYTKGVNCTGISHEEVKNFYTDEEKKIMQAAAYVEGTFYSNICRLQETAEKPPSQMSGMHLPQDRDWL